MYYDLNTGKRKIKAISTRKSDAIKWNKKKYDELMAIYLGEPDAHVEDITFESLINLFLQTKEHRTAVITYNTYKTKNQFLKEYLNNNFPAVTTVRQIRKLYIEEFLKSRFEDGRSYRTLEADLQAIKALFKFGVEEGYLTKSPAERIKPFKNPYQSKKVEFWTKEEVRKILTEIKPGWQDAHEFLYLTGIRKAELMFLTWGDVTIRKKSTSHITIQAKPNWTPKNNNRRTIPLNNRAYELIMKQPRGEMDEYVFRGPRGGKQIHRDKIYRELKRALQAIDLTGDVHQWRHTFASHLVVAGVGIETVSKLLGHSSLEMTMIYAHLAPDHLRNAVKKLDLSLPTDTD